MSRRLTFGICSDQNLPFATLVEQWRRFEELGFDSLWVCDHFQQPSQPTGPYHEGWTLLAALATQTRRARLGVLVSSNTFRHPALLAQEAATVDHISGGRLELGLGAGWFEPEHAMFGLPFPPPAVRVAQFREAVEIVDALLRGTTITFAGAHYQLQEALLRPGPLQQPRPPLVLGGAGPKMLRIVAAHADTWNSYGSVAEMLERNLRLDEHCLALGRDPAGITRSLYAITTLMPVDPWESLSAFQELVSLYREVGIQQFIFEPPRDEQWSAFERIAMEAMPSLKTAAVRD